jgi:hypothetical protein
VRICEFERFVVVEDGGHPEFPGLIPSNEVHRPFDVVVVPVRYYGSDYVVLAVKAGKVSGRHWLTSGVTKRINNQPLGIADVNGDTFAIAATEDGKFELVRRGRVREHELSEFCSGSAALRSSLCLLRGRKGSIAVKQDARLQPRLDRLTFLGDKDALASHHCEPHSDPEPIAVGVIQQ